MRKFFLASADHGNFQFQLCKQLDAGPFTRDYLYRS
jgi:hypothetical protein